MTRDEVVKGLELCITPDPADCADCPAYEDVNRADENHYIRCRNVLMREALALLKEEPRRGKWVMIPGYVTPGGDPVWGCSECGKGIHVYGIEHTTYGADVSDGQWLTCPNCGALMEGEDTECET